MDRTIVLGDTDVDFHAEIPLVAFLGREHLRISLPTFVLDGTRSRDQGGINNCALFHCRTALLEVGFDRLKDLLACLVLVKQLAKCQDRCLIREQVPDKVNSYKVAYGLSIGKIVFHFWIA